MSNEQYSRKDNPLWTELQGPETEQCSRENNQLQTELDQNYRSIMYIDTMLSIGS